jgi:hypothetical protein
MVTDVGVTPVWSWKADAGIGGVDEPPAVFPAELVEEQAVRSPATTTRQTATAGSSVHRIRTIS